MKTLTLIRHAKAERPEGYPTDFERPLTARGHKDSEHIAALLVKLQPSVDLIISSPAARTAQTTDHLTDSIGYTKPETWNEGVYLATAETLLAILKATDDEIEHVVLVGHNPGMEELAAGLCSGTPDNSVLTMPTATLANIVLDISHWSLLRWGVGQLKLLITPKVFK